MADVSDGAGEARRSTAIPRPPEAGGLAHEQSGQGRGTDPSRSLTIERLSASNVNTAWHRLRQGTAGYWPVPLSSSNSPSGRSTHGVFSSSRSAWASVAILTRTGGDVTGASRRSGRWQGRGDGPHRRGVPRAVVIERIRADQERTKALARYEEPGWLASGREIGCSCRS